MKVQEYRLREALRFMLLPPAVRIRRAQAHIGPVGVVPPYMDDAVLEELRQRGHTRRRQLPKGAEPEVGATVVVNKGRLSVVEVTAAGEMWLESEETP